MVHNNELPLSRSITLENFSLICVVQNNYKNVLIRLTYYFGHILWFASMNLIQRNKKNIFEYSFSSIDAFRPDLLKLLLIKHLLFNGQ